MSETEDARASADVEITSDDDRPAYHLDDLPDGSGCAEIWDHLSEHRKQD